MSAEEARNAGSPTRAEPRVRGIEWALRMTGRIIAILGLAVLYLSFALLTLAEVAPPLWVFQVAIILVAAGCLWLVCVLAWPGTNKGESTVEGMVGILSVLPGFLLGFMLAFLGLQTPMFWLVNAVVLTPSSIALFLLATRAKREAESWRNIGSAG